MKRMGCVLYCVLWGLVPCAESGAQEGAVEWLHNLDGYTQAVAGNVDVQPWWHQWNDPLLVRFIEEALARNHDIAAAIARLEVAEAQVRRGTAPLWPIVTFDGSINAQPSDALGFQFKELFNMGGAPPTGETGISMGGSPESALPEVLLNTSAMFTIRYQVDLWGRAVLTYRASQALREAAQGDSDALAAALTIQVGTAYADLAAARMQVQVVQEQVELNQSLLELLQHRYEQGQATGAEVMQQRQQLAAAQARLPAAQAVGRVARHRLEVLRGRLPSAPGQETPISPEATLPSVLPLPATGGPGDLLAHRPELRAGLARLRAAEKQVRSAKRAALPTLALSAQGGGQGFRANDFRHQLLWGAGVSVSVPLFQGLGEFAALAEARAQVRAAEESLHQAALTAVAEVEGALAAAAEQRAQLEAHERLLDAARLSFSMTRDSYAGGIGSYLAVLAALGAWQQAELTLVQSRRAVVATRLQLWQALGGPWTEGLALREQRSEQ